MGKIKDIIQIHGYAIKPVWQRVIIIVVLTGLFFGIHQIVASLWQTATAIKILSISFIFWIVIIGIISYIMVIVGAIKIKEDNENLKKFKLNIETNHYLQELDAKFFGISRRIHHIECELMKEGYINGSCNTKLVAKADGIDSIEHFINNPHVDQGGKILLDAGKTRARNIEATPVIIKQEKDVLFWKMQFIPSLKNGQEVEYYYKTKGVPGSFVMNFEDMAVRDIKREFMAIRVSYPTEFFIYKLIFPEGFRPLSYNFEVWLGEGEVNHKFEMLRVEKERYFSDFFEGDRLVLCLKIRHPIHGLRYALTWIPPKRN
ncbi:MAG: hypothetical protein WC321_04560 [Candidatus Omnitrophota bacterium]|jgi:TM2 domain-containing membrane protein YozV